MTEREWLDIFGTNLAEMLEEAWMTQKELAEETGISEGAISNYIHKRRMPTVKAIINIAEALDCSLDDFLYFGDRID